jgi:hypothetical protein
MAVEALLPFRLVLELSGSLWKRVAFRHQYERFATVLLTFNGDLSKFWPPLIQCRVPTRGKQMKEPRVPFRFEHGIEVLHSDGGEAWFVVWFMVRKKT